MHRDGRVRPFERIGGRNPESSGRDGSAVGFSIVEDAVSGISPRELQLLENGAFARLGLSPAAKQQVLERIAALRASAEERGRELLISEDGEALIIRFSFRGLKQPQQYVLCRVEHCLTPAP